MYYIHERPFQISGTMVTGGPFATGRDTPGAIWYGRYVDDDFDFAEYQRRARQEFLADPGVQQELEENRKWEAGIRD